MSGQGSVRFEGRILYLTQDPALILRQLAGERIAWDPSLPLLDQISTDEITPGWTCFHYDEALGEFALVGLRGGVIAQGALQRGGFSVLVSGEGKGSGSSREHAPFAELSAGIKLVIARSMEKIYRQNCQNIGLYTSTDFSLLERIERGEPIPVEAFSRDLDPISAAVVNAGGLFAYSRQRMGGAPAPSATQARARPMTLGEKILAAHAVIDAGGGQLGVPAVAPGDALFVRTDVRFSHEYVTPMADALFRRALGDAARIREPESVFTFRDHLSLLGQVMPEEKRRAGLLARAEALATTQAAFADKHRLKLYGEVEGGGSHAICHNAVFEDLALPGQVVTGTDSHTCMAGALGALAFGVGATDMANAWYTADVRVRVPESVCVWLTGSLHPDVCAKDVMLFLLSQPFFRSGRGVGKLLEFAGPAIAGLPLDERATLTNMAVEAGGFSGIIAADDAVIDYLLSMRPGLEREALRARCLTSDAGAEYHEALEVDLGSIVPMVATPGDPRNGMPMALLAQPVAIDIAYGGSCTGGKKADMDMYASVLGRAVARGLRVPPHVTAYIQFGSQHIRAYAEQRGYLELFRRAGVALLPPSCGACIQAGPGASSRADQVTVSAINRNFPGRSGPGQVYLASPSSVAASAVAGRLLTPAELFSEP